MEKRWVARHGPDVSRNGAVVLGALLSSGCMNSRSVSTVERRVRNGGDRSFERAGRPSTIIVLTHRCSHRQWLPIQFVDRLKCKRADTSGKAVSTSKTKHRKGGAKWQCTVRQRLRAMNQNADAGRDGAHLPKTCPCRYGLALTWKLAGAEGLSS